MNREIALKIYYDNPAICKNCGKIIEVPEGVSPSEVRRKKFCNSFCAASYNNKNRELIKTKKTNKDKICPICGGVKSKQAEHCKNVLIN